MPILNYTTKIDPNRTIGEIQGILVRHGAKRISIDYDETGNPVALQFQFMKEGVPYTFALPCRWQGVLNVLTRDKTVKSTFKTEAQAFRVSWRVLKDWTEAHLALVEAEMATPFEIFLPFAVGKDGRTLAQHVESSKLLENK